MTPSIPIHQLDSDLFSFPEMGTPILQRQAKLQILSGVARIHSIATSKYCVLFGRCLVDAQKDTTVNVLVGVDGRRVDNISTMSLNLVLKELNDKIVIGTTHPIKYIITTNDLDKKQFDQLYAPFDDQWVKYIISESKNKAKLPAYRRPHLSKMIKSSTSKNQSITPDLYKTDTDGMTVGANKFKAAHHAEKGMWPVTIGQATDIAEHFNTELPKLPTPFKMIGNTGIMLYRPSKDKFMLLKGDEFKAKAKRAVARFKLTK